MIIVDLWGNNIKLIFFVDKKTEEWLKPYFDTKN